MIRSIFLGGVGFLIAFASCTDTGDMGDRLATALDKPSLGPTSPTKCQGECVPYARGNNWEDEPQLVWIGHEAEFPGCPDGTEDDWQLVAGLVGYPFCPKCECRPPPSAVCELPTEFRAHAALCGAGGDETPLDELANWDGACSSMTGIGASQTCNGELCLQSVTVGALKLTEAPCMPVETPGERLYGWGKVALACAGEEAPACEAPLFCSPKVPAGFRRCVLSDVEGIRIETECPDGYPNREIFFYHDSLGGVADDRQCNPCTCTNPTGGTCTARMHFYSDATCSTEIYYQDASSEHPVCHDVVPAGVALLSKLADPPQYLPGQCAPIGGEEVGTIQPTRPVTMCCQ